MLLSSLDRIDTTLDRSDCRRLCLGVPLEHSLMPYTTMLNFLSGFILGGVSVMPVCTCTFGAVLGVGCLWWFNYPGPLLHVELEFTCLSGLVINISLCIGYTICLYIAYIRLLKDFFMP